MFNFKHAENVVSTESLTKEEMVQKYFKVLDEECKEKIKKWRLKQKAPVDEGQAFYLYNLKNAENDFNNPIRTATLEPAVRDEKLVYCKGGKLTTGLSIESWQKLVFEFYPERKSRFSSVGELFLFFALRAAEKYWTLEDICTNSSGFGNFIDSPKHKSFIEHAGARECSGYYDGVGNTSKLCMYDKCLYASVGGWFDKSGAEYPVAGYVEFSKDTKKVYRYAVPQIVCD